MGSNENPGKVQQGHPSVRNCAMGRRLIQKRNGGKSLLKFVHLNMINRKKREKNDKLCKETREYLLQIKAKRKQLEEECAAFLEKQRVEGKLNEEEIREIEIAINSDADDDEEYLEFIYEKALTDDEPSLERKMKLLLKERMMKILLMKNLQKN